MFKAEQSKYFDETNGWSTKVKAEKKYASS